MASQDKRRKTLLSAAKQGDDDALGELLEDLRPMLRAEAHRSLQGPIQARVAPSDIVNLTWWSAFRGFPKFEGDVDGFIAWLNNIHKKNILDVRRAHNADRRDIGRERSPTTGFSGAQARTSTPSQKLVRKERRNELNAALNELPLAQRQAVQMRFFDGLSVAQITEQMGRSETAVAGLLKRGVSTLRSKLKSGNSEST